VSDVAILYQEELKAIARGRYSWLGAAVVLLAVGGLATVATQDTWLDGYGIIAYGLIPLGFIPLAAGAIASPRANRFVECVFTSPIERRDWLFAKVLVLVTLSIAYYLALLPMLAVYIHHVGLPFLLGRFLIWTPGIMLASISIGTLIGVLFIGRSVAAPAASGMGVLLAYVGFVPLQELMVARGNGATHSGHIVLASPAVLLKNALGFTLVARDIPATTAYTWISFMAVIFGAFTLAVWIFLYAQGVETWEATRRQRWTISLAIFALILMPILLADTNYEAAAPSPNQAPALHGISPRNNGNLAMVKSGTHMPKRCCNQILNRDEAALGTDEATRRDLLLLLPVETTQSIADLSVRVFGENGLEIISDNSLPLEAHAYDHDTGPAAADGHHIVNGWVVRVPVTLTPTKPWDIGGNRYPVNVSATYHVSADDSVQMFSARGAVEAGVSNALYEMGIASFILPLICFIAGFGRWRRTR